MRRKVAYLVILCVFLTLFVPAHAFGKSGQHLGEQKMLDLDIQFYDQCGVTITNPEGIYYLFNNDTFFEPRIYPSKYWGEYPLYVYGSRVGVLINITNKGPHNKAKYLIETSSQVLNTDGSIGMSLVEPGNVEVEVAKGETKTVDASFNNDMAKEIFGLDRFLVRVLHADTGNSDASLILSKEAIFCPPPLDLIQR